MKKIFKLIFQLVLIIGLSGCNDNGKEPEIIDENREGGLEQSDPVKDEAPAIEGDSIDDGNEFIMPEFWIPVQNLHYTSCENKGVETRQDGNSHDESYKTFINYKTSGTVLSFEQRLLLNCCFENIKTEFALQNNNVYINIVSGGNECNCICPVLINYDVPDLIVGEKYEIIILLNKNEYSRFEILF